jgi:integrase
MKERSPGVWWLRAYAGRNSAGKPVQISRTVRGGKRLAQAELAKLVTEVAERGEQVAPLRRVTTVTELLDRWLEYLTPLREPGTIRGYRQHAKAIEAAFGSVPVSKLSAQHLNRAYRTWLGQGRAPRTIRQRHAIMSSALHQAQRWGIVTRAVTDLASPPAIHSHPQVATDPAMVRGLIDAAEESNPVLAAAIALAAVTGARRGELCGLRWSDIDTAGLLHIRRAVKHALDPHELVVGPTKTRSERRVSMDDLAMAVLAAHRARVEHAAEMTGVALGLDAYVLSLDPSGTEPLRPDTLSNSFARLARQQGAKLRFYDLRHFSATQLIGAGVDVRTVAGRLGHADASTTLRVYAHALQQRDQAAAEVLGGLLFKQLPPV